MMCEHRNQHGLKKGAQDVSQNTYSGTSSERYAPTNNNRGISPSKHILFNKSNVAISLHCKSSRNNTNPNFKFVHMIFNSSRMAYWKTRVPQFTKLKRMRATSVSAWGLQRHSNIAHKVQMK